MFVNGHANRNNKKLKQSTTKILKKSFEQKMVLLQTIQTTTINPCHLCHPICFLLSFPSCRPSLCVLHPDVLKTRDRVVRSNSGQARPCVCHPWYTPF